MISVTFSGELDMVKHQMRMFLDTATEAVIEPKPRATRGTSKKSEETSAPPNLAPPAVQTVAAPPVNAPPPPTVQIPSDQVVQEALVAVNEKFGIDKAIECLTKFGVKRGRELTPEQKQPFYDLCMSLVK